MSDDDPVFDEETRKVARQSRDGPLGVVIRVVDSSAKPATVKLSGGTCTIGSDATCDLRINDRTVSRTHVELTLVPEGVRLIDLGSSNGTYYGEHRIERAVLSPGATIRLGSVEVRIDADTQALDAEQPYQGDSYRGVLGRSSAMRRLFSVLRRLEGSLVNVLLQGESGVGKEVVARAIHDGSSVASGPLVTVNCGALPRDLVASELFGHRRGAFTGALENRRGAFESADGGTLFLDEIGELPLEVQPSLLRALETGEIRAVGSDQAKQVRVRVLAATLRDLASETRAGRFREDLYYRLAVIKLQIPALASRPDDVEQLAQLFARGARTELPPNILVQLRGRPWPGNVRELRNAIQAYAALGVVPEPGSASADLLDLALGNLVDLSRSYADQKDVVMERFLRVYLSSLLVYTNGNQTAAARIAGMDRTYLGRLLVKYGIEKST